MHPNSHALIAAVAALSWSIAPAAFSQTEDELPPPPDASQELEAAQDSAMPEPEQPAAAPAESATSAAAIEDKKIEQFADAYVAVQTIQQKVSNELQKAPDPEQANKVKASAEADMIAAVERSGLQVQEFNQIAETMAADVNVRSRVAAEIEKRSTGGGS